jgi:cytosine/adenosine deaminase-related metal-dependent hydrolase
MILKNLHIIGNSDGPKSIIIGSSIIQSICNENEIKNHDREIIDFDNAIVFPGLINSHDHLEFNLFPPLGNKKYENYIEWGEDIHKNNKAQIESVLKIPVELRYKWGILNNLFSGITTVFQHGKILKNLGEELIDIYNGGKIVHSVRLEKYWRLRINLPGFEKVVIHIGEGNDNSSKEEIKTLIKWNFLKKKIIGIHAIALEKENAKYFEAITWCPASNYFLFNRTANIGELKEETKIIFGTDSAVSADGNIWDHLRFARKIKALDDNDLFRSITSTPAEVWDLKALGSVSEQYLADLVIAKNGLKNRWDSFFSLTPGDFIMILKKGRIIFWDESIKDQLNFSGEEIKLFSSIIIDGKVKYVLGNIKELVNSVRQYNSDILFPFSIC